MRSSAVLLVAMLVLTAGRVVSQQNPSSSAQSGPGSSTSQSTSSHDLSSDDLLRQKVQAQLNTDGALGDVRAEAVDGAVRLTGTVASRADQGRALELARSVPGVRSVKEHIEVRRDAAQADQPTVTGHTAINETNQNAAGSVAGNAGVAGTSPATGQAATSAPTGEDVSSADDNAAPATRVPGEADNETLRQQIESAFQSDPALAGTHVAVTVTDSRIELSGMVPTAHEKQTAYRIAQSYGNNRRVEDAGLDVESRTGATGAAGGAGAQQQKPLE